MDIPAIQKLSLRSSDCTERRKTLDTSRSPGISLKSVGIQLAKMENTTMMRRLKLEERVKMRGRYTCLQIKVIGISKHIYRLCSNPLLKDTVCELCTC